MLGACVLIYKITLLWFVAIDWSRRHCTFNSQSPEVVNRYFLYYLSSFLFKCRTGWKLSSIKVTLGSAIKLGFYLLWLLGSWNPKVTLEQKSIVASSSTTTRVPSASPTPRSSVSHEYCPVSVGKQLLSNNSVHLFKSYLSLFLTIQYLF